MTRGHFDTEYKFQDAPWDSDVYTAELKIYKRKEMRKFHRDAEGKVNQIDWKLMIVLMIGMN